MAYRDFSFHHTIRFYAYVDKSPHVQKAIIAKGALKVIRRFGERKFGSLALGPYFNVHRHTCRSQRQLVSQH